MCSTPTNNKLASTYEAENQAMLEHFNARSCTVARDQAGKVVQASVTFPDGTSEPIYHVSVRDAVGPVSVTSSTRKSETPRTLSTVHPNGVRATYEGHLEIPESEQQWEIHLQPKHDGSPKNPSHGTQTSDAGSGT